jgi:four helix bundle protein
VYVGGNIVFIKSKKFALRIIKLYKHLSDNKKEFVLSKQLLRCGTSIGANISEAVNSMSKKEFIAKMNISLKESAETEYWLELLRDSEYITKAEYESINNDCSEIKSLLISIIKTANANLRK